MKHLRTVHEAKTNHRKSATVALALALSMAPRARAEQNATPVAPPPKAAAAAGPSPKAADAPKGTKAGAAPSAPLPDTPATTPATTPGPATPAPTEPPPAPADAEARGPSAPPATPPKVEGGPPPVYFVEPESSGETPDTAGPPPPPTAVYEPPLPPEPRNLVPNTALWAGARVSWFAPFGSLWVDTFDSRAGLYYRRRLFEDYASSGPAFEFDLGARLARRYIVFALMEHAFLGRGSLDENAYGGQSRGRTSLYGAGLRFSSDPTSLGFLLEIGLGYREFRANWNDGTELALTGGWLDARVGIGADVRVNKYFSVSPMIAFGGGTFGKARWSGPGRDGEAIEGRDDLGQYATFSAQLGGHFDIH